MGDMACWLRGEALLWTGDPPVREYNWQARVNEPLSAGDLQRLRHSVISGRPFGDETWWGAAAKRLGLESCLRPRGRPRKSTP
jgi:putative transposase